MPSIVASQINRQSDEMLLLEAIEPGQRTFQSVPHRDKRIGPLDQKSQDNGQVGCHKKPGRHLACRFAAFVILAKKGRMMLFLSIKPTFCFAVVICYIGMRVSR
jgi:hypothetical protein